MKKSNLALALVSILAGISLSSCSSDPIKSNKDAIITINNGKDSAQSIKVDDIFNKYMLKSAGISAYYNAICEVIVRGTVPETDEITKKAERSVTDIKDQAKSNASANGTSYDTELEKLLTEKKAEDLDELKDNFVYDLLKEKAYDQYFDENVETLLSRYVNEMLPYHVRHILVKVSASSLDGGYDGQITEQEAKNLTAVIEQLAGGSTFGSVAHTRSEDANSAKVFGDLGLMTTATTYVNEFKLGLFAYDALFNKTATQTTRKTHINITDDAETYLDSKGIGMIEYSDVLKLKNSADIVKDNEGNKVNDDDASYYPRNIYFNRFFNKHTMQVIVHNQATKGFKAVEDIPELVGVIPNGKFVLVDELGHVVLAVRSGTGSGDSGYQGIHFITVQKSPLVESNLNTYYKYNEGVEYYNRTEVLGNSFVGFMQNTNAEYKKRAETVENEVKGFDKMIDAAIYHKLKDALNDKDEPKFVINSEIKVSVPVYDASGNKTSETEELTLESALETYITNTISFYNSENKLTMNRTWDEFVEKLQLLDTYSVRLKPLVCAETYKNSNTATEYQTGGACYVKK